MRNTIIITTIIFAIAGYLLYLMWTAPDTQLLYEARQKCAVTGGEVVYNEEYKVYQCK